MPNNSSENDMFLGASPDQFQNAKLLRKRETEAEKLLWAKLSGKQLGVKFRRQHPLHDYIVDFYCHSKKLVIEVDGPIHNTAQNQSYDRARSKAFSEFNILTIRFTNEEVINNIDLVIFKIKETLLSNP